MPWLKDRWRLLWEESAHNKILLTFAAAACVILGTLDQLKLIGQKIVSHWITSPQNEGSIFGFPSWVLGVTLALFFVSWWLLETALRFRKSLVPKIDVCFNPNAEGIVWTPTHVHERDAKGRITIREDEATYINVTIMALSQVTVKNCVAFVTRIEKKLIPTGPFVDVPIFSVLTITPSPIDIHPKVPALLSFLKSGKSDNRLELNMAWPLRLRNAFNDRATYRFTIEVNADGVTKSIQVEVDWAGKWDAITARQRTDK